MQETTAKDAALNIFAILGFIALLVAGLWATIQLLQLLLGIAGSTQIGKSALAPLSSLSLPSVAIDVPTNTLSSNNAFTVDWSISRATEDGITSLSYACRDGLVLKVRASADSEYAIPCSAPYAIPKDATSLSLTPALSKGSTIEVPLTLTYTTNGTSVKDTAVIVIAKETHSPLASTAHPKTVAAPVAEKKIEVAPALPTTSQIQAPVPTAANSTKKTAPQPAPAPAPKTTPLPPQTPAVIPSTKPLPPPTTPKKTLTESSDLVAVIRSIGKERNGAVTAQSHFSTRDTVHVVLEVTNTGDKAVEKWGYTLTLPTDPAYTYVSPVQPTLFAGSKASVTLSFDRLKPGKNAVILSADPTNTIVESNELNNTATVYITVQ